MSRTDKDAPHWVRAMHDPNALVHHGWRCLHSSYGASRPSTALPCDLDTNRVSGRVTSCFRWTRDRTHWYTGVSPSRVRRRSLYFGPERAAVRSSLTSAVKDWNANGEGMDVDPPTRQARRSDWYGGWWD